jgi:glycosyltransferase involved in cell wall biosynthesis
MLSICIPQYNFDTSNLVRALTMQGNALGIPYEIIVIDDASIISFSPPFVHQQVHFTQLGTNIGRSAIRNLLAMNAQYDYLIFMDCDAQIVDEQYLERYWAVAKGEIIVCGGRQYAPMPPEVGYRLRWQYGTARECPKATERQRAANVSFLSNNFLIHKNLFNATRFDETLSTYGHEDTLFGYQLAQKNIIIQHIDNPLRHIDEESNATFLQKTQQGLSNLLTLHRRLADPHFSSSIKILRYLRTLQRFGLLHLTAGAFALLKPLVIKNLFSSRPNLLLFDAYKLGYLCQLATTFKTH